MGSSRREDSLRNWMAKKECGKKGQIDRSLVVFVSFKEFYLRALTTEFIVIILHLCQAFFLLKYFHRGPG